MIMKIKFKQALVFTFILSLYALASTLEYNDQVAMQEINTAK